MDRTHDGHAVMGFVESVDDPVGASTCAVSISEWRSESFPDPEGIGPRGARPSPKVRSPQAQSPSNKLVIKWSQRQLLPGYKPVTCSFAPPTGLEPVTCRLTVGCSAN